MDIKLLCASLPTSASHTATSTTIATGATCTAPKHPRAAISS